MVEELLKELAAIGERSGELQGAESEQRLREINAAIQRALGAEMKKLRDVPKDRKGEVGRAANEVKQKLAAAFDARLEAIAREAREAELTGPRMDLSLPGRRQPPGRLHPITRVMHELSDVLVSLGFDVAEGPLVDLHENCFELLGFPPDHPATDMQDTFYLLGEDGEPDTRRLLRTHTSTIQVRTMQKRKPPLAIIGPGAVFRRDEDRTHSPQFHQVEGLLVDEEVSMADLKGLLMTFLSRLYGAEVEVRLRPSYFPFVEPGAELDVRRKIDGEWSEWMEIGGCGMVHPVVFENVGYDPEKWTGLAFGMGIDRMAVIRYGVTVTSEDGVAEPGIKPLFDNDIRFLRSF